MGLCVAVQVTADEASPDCWPGLAPGIKGGLQKFWGGILNYGTPSNMGTGIGAILEKISEMGDKIQSNLPLFVLKFLSNYEVLAQ